MKLQIIKQLSRSSNKVCLAKNENNVLVVLKKYQDSATLKIETTILNQLSISGYAPKIVEMGEDYIIYEYIEGDLLKDKFTFYLLLVIVQVVFIRLSLLSFKCLKIFVVK